MTNDVSAQVLLGFLNDAWQRAGAAANSLREQLVADHSAAVSLIKQGAIASVGKNSANQSYKPYGPGSLTQVQVVELIGNLLGLYDQLKSKLTAEFTASADFNYTVPDGFDFDPPLYDSLCRIFNALAAGGADLLPDITQLRLPPNTILNPALTTW